MATRSDTRSIALLVVGACCAAGFVTLARWIAWWPHSDNRQNLAPLGIVVFLIVGAPAAVAAIARTKKTTRALGLLLASLLFGFSLGFAVLADATRDARSSDGRSGVPVPADAEQPPGR